MSFDDLQPRIAVAVGLLALIPAIIYAVGRPSFGGYVAAINVVLIFWSLYLATEPVANGHHGSESGSSAP